jgi:hypothetical protein
MVKQMKPGVVNRRQLDGLPPPPSGENKTQQLMFDERQELTNLKNAAAKKKEEEEEEDEDDDEEDYDEEDEEKSKASANPQPATALAIQEQQ